MKCWMSFFVVLICTAVLAAQGQARKGCNAFGHACYGGHGKRSLGFIGNNGNNGNTNGNENGNFNADINLNTLEDARADSAVFRALSNEPSIFSENELNTIPRYHLIKILKPQYGSRSKLSQRLNEIDYPMSGEVYNRDNAFN
ncbi:neuropeptide CCHamide-2 [Teleopsis dalmanni]|uniref:neuropeptide CCHamide-2 n=1 Tax=Teleopsis dalmanni TaxID=139649 RepID=UPI0018CCC918|nr:neuropeptide CCHamide-2 [Teleopsis dalmanni]XP_037945780.1 neuropeptide CCHamide-2 [Teleopsis dalmanni]XP_037945781.1 neuropeptide CCHamide-2 [Teleopsis dalmanni]